MEVIVTNSIHIQNAQQVNTYCKNTCLLHYALIFDSVLENNTKLYFNHLCDENFVFIESKRNGYDNTSHPKF